MSMFLFAPICGARLRKKPGQTCRAPALKGQRHCRLHAGRPKGSVRPEGLAATRTAHAAYYAKYWAAKARGEPVRLPGGRKKRWPIARPWRFRLSPEDEARVLAHMAEDDRRVRGGEPRPPWQATTLTTVDARSLERCERALILAMNRPHPPRSETVEQVYADVRAAEAMFGDAGSEVRLARLAWEIERFRRLRNVVPSSRPLRADEPLTGRPHVATPPSPPATPPDTFRTAVSPSCMVESADELRAAIDDRKHRLAQCNLPESSARRLDTELALAGSEAAQLAILDRWLAAMERAYAMTEAIVAGRDRRAEERCTRPREERPHSIAPWLRRP
jgi:hypothetical protein